MDVLICGRVIVAKLLMFAGGKTGPVVLVGTAKLAMFTGGKTGLVVLVDGPITISTILCTLSMLHSELDPYNVHSL